MADLSARQAPPVKPKALDPSKCDSNNPSSVESLSQGSDLLLRKAKHGAKPVRMRKRSPLVSAEDALWARCTKVPRVELSECVEVKWAKIQEEGLERFRQQLRTRLIEIGCYPDVERVITRNWDRPIQRLETFWMLEAEVRRGGKVFHRPKRKDCALADIALSLCFEPYHAHAATLAFLLPDRRGG